MIGRSIAFMLVALGASRGPRAHTVRVSHDGIYTTVAAGVAAARDGDTVLVAAGLYREPRIIVDKAIALLGDGDPVIDGQGHHSIMLITANDVTLRGFVFRNPGVSFTEDRSAVRVNNAHGCDIEHNRVENGFFGIYLAGTTDCRIANNTLRAAGVRETEAGNGIQLWTARRITIENNDIVGFRDGIYFEFVHDSDIRGNTSAGNLRYGLHFMYSDNCRYVKNVFTHNGSGVAVMYTKTVEMTGNRFEDNWGPAAYGLLLKEISDAHLEGNVFERNTTGLFADGANRIQAIGNSFTGNGWAVRLDASTVDGRFERNNFTGNSFDVATNSRSPSTKFSGNYWDDYRGYDLDRDGTGDVPHHPVRLFSMIVEQRPSALILMRSTFSTLLDAAERVLPSLTPEALVDATPAMRPIR